jgi:hypothetical protein
VAVALSAEAAGHLFGPLANRLSPPDHQAIARLVGSTPAAVAAWYSQVLPEAWHAEVFLPVETCTGSLCRGRVIRVSCAPVSASRCNNWQRDDGPPAAYAQVAVGAGDGWRGQIRVALERPFTVGGMFSDTELLSLVAVVRSGARAPLPVGDAALRALPISGQYPITALGRSDDGTVWVRTSESLGSGERGQFRFADGRWQPLGSTGWVK